MKALELGDLIGVIITIAVGYALVRFIMYEPPLCPNGQTAIRDEANRTVCIMGRQP